ncbi:hypothetical protein IGI04_016018 [Brassica rapa subsp. trilocularis]|uniref:Cytochrome P450 n=2 Tax=Brassica TaxID=3705 RepID=A0ABQ8DK37_BRANA|nr:hypothetical protein IGI04_016018 [Brassica rapa subsp. trilocularis]KAH0929742.1 hypothetical protein HID58_015469 [Brassica napus]
MTAMVHLDIQNCLIFTLVFLFPTLFLFVFFFFKEPKKSFDLPPSPPSLPIIGHLHLIISSSMHKCFQKISSKYGQFLHLRIFHVPIVLVSSPTVAYEIFKAHDTNVSYRGPIAIDECIVFGSSGYIRAPSGDYWRFMKKIIMAKALGPQALERTRGVRLVELERFHRNLLDKAMKKESVEVGEEAMRLVNNTLGKMSMGSSFSVEDNDGGKVCELSVAFTSLCHKFCVAQVFHKPLEKLGISFLKKDVMEELFVGAGDSSSSTTRWAMAEIINNPKILERLREEIDSVVGKNRLVQETDLTNLPYLQAVVKEALRLHPVGAVVPREFQEGCTIGGFYIPEGTSLAVNSYAIMRDPDSWEDPCKFKPERFLTSSRSWKEEERKEQALKFLAFGAGRRGCPGSNLGSTFVGTAVGVMVQCFDWEIEGDKVNMEEASGLRFFMALAKPLKCTPSPRNMNHLPSDSRGQDYTRFQLANI